MGSLRRLSPFSREWGYDRGTPVDRYYIERFLAARSDDVHGRVLEVGTDKYTKRFGGERVTQSDVLHVSDQRPSVTIIGDLTDPALFPADVFDCVILTSTLHFIYDVRAALKTVERALRPAGVLLATFPGISPISRYDMDRWGDYWRFTTRSLARLFEEVFPGYEVEVEAHGNVLVAAAFLFGLAAEDLDENELDYHDSDYQLLLTVRACMPRSGNHLSKSIPTGAPS
jgi:SAM-dependent methyltransferase